MHDDQNMHYSALHMSILVYLANYHTYIATQQLEATTTASEIPRNK